jgi:predicted transcriptional regulator
MSHDTISVAIDPEHYLDDLEARMQKYGITRAELAREMDVVKSQISRMFNQRMMPQMATLGKIERAMIELVKEKRRAARRVGAK